MEDMESIGSSCPCHTHTHTYKHTHTHIHRRWFYSVLHPCLCQALEAAQAALEQKVPWLAAAALGEVEVGAYCALVS